MRGAWVDKTKLTNGTVVKILSEAKIEPGQTGEQLVAKVKIKGSEDEAKNIAINKPSRKALMEVYGNNTTDWIGKIFTIALERVVIGGKRSIAAYLIPQGYELSEDNGGYLVVQPVGMEKQDTVEPEPVADTLEEEINPEDIPF